MKKMTLFIVSCLVTINMLAFNPNDRVLGKWINENRTRIIEFVKTNHGYDAYIRHEAQKSINTYLPLAEDNVNVPPVELESVKSGAAVPSEHERSCFA